MKNKRNSTWSACVLGALLGVTSANTFSLSVEARWVEVHVLDKQTGNAVKEAAVCLGTTARPDQFGARRSDKEGVVRFEGLSQLPVAMLATVSKPGYQGRRQLLEPQYQNRILILKVVSGGGGPQCDAPLAQVENDAGSGLTIESITIKTDATADGSGQVQVSVQVSGQANQIRISEQADFSGAPWQTLAPAVAYSTSQGKGVKQIYVQVRRQARTKGASIEVVSQPGKTTYRVH